MITEEEAIDQMTEGTMVTRETDQDTDITVDKDSTVILVDIMVVEGGSTVEAHLDTAEEEVEVLMHHSDTMEEVGISEMIVVAVAEADIKEMGVDTRVEEEVGGGEVVSLKVLEKPRI